MYKNMYYCLMVPFSPQSVELFFYHGLHTESEVTGGATGDICLLFCAVKGMRAALGTRKVSCPSGVGTTWKPP